MGATPSAAFCPANLPTLLDFAAPRLRAYPRETVIAEKVEAMAQLGIANSRMKDFFDILILSQQFTFEGELLAQAIRATFDRRRTPRLRSNSRTTRPRGPMDRV